ncbi:MAG: PIN domain-containing protein [Mariniphaga sp.]|nr:PIN domain-containing protein [Mariniphaga sp.]
MIIVVNDANVLIDIVKLQLLPQFFDLDLEFHTTSLILNELHSEQVEQLQKYINCSLLNVNELSADELMEIVTLQTERPQLSEQDCSAIVCARRISGEILTSDNNLRKFAAIKGVSVKGHLWIFDLLVAQNLISAAVAIDKLAELREIINPRLGLPKAECENRITVWKTLVI